MLPTQSTTHHPLAELVHVERQSEPPWNLRVGHDAQFRRLHRYFLRDRGASFGQGSAK